MSIPKDNKGHNWKRHADGSVNMVAYTAAEYENGPECEVCGYYYCEHCQSEPSIECTGGT